MCDQMSAKRDIENQISQIMGSYLLKGYTLLDSHCPTCQTPLMKTKASEEFCIYCKEINANSQMKSTITITGEDSATNSRSQTKGMTDVKSDSRQSPSNQNQLNDSFNETIDIVRQKIDWAADRLKNCDQIPDCLQLISLIQSSADLISSLNRLTKDNQ